MYDKWFLVDDIKNVAKIKKPFIPGEIVKKVKWKLKKYLYLQMLT